MNETAKLLCDIKVFLKSTEMRPTMFGKHVGNPKLIERLEEGGSVTLKTAERIRDFISNYDSTDHDSHQAA